MGTTPWSNDQARDLILPPGAGPNDPRIVIGPDVPPEVVAFYAALGANLVVDGWIGFYIDATHYFYWVAGNIPNAGFPIRFMGYGTVASGLVNELSFVSRSTLGDFTEYGIDADFIDLESSGGRGVLLNRTSGDPVLMGNPAAPIDYFLNGVNHPRGPLYFESITTSAASGAVAGTEYLMFTTTSNITFINGRAYEVTFHGIINSAVTQVPLLHIRKTNATGTLLINGGRQPITNAGTNLGFEKRGIIVNTSGADVVAPLALTVTPSSATLVNVLGAAASSQAYWRVVDIGSTGDYQGVSV